MSDPAWKSHCKDKLTTAQEALSNLRNGQTVYVGTGAGEPRLLTEALAAEARRLTDVQVLHLMAQREAKLPARSFRYNTLYVGRGMEEAVAQGLADYTPMNVSELPVAMAQGIVRVDVALIQVTPPDRLGNCSLGIAVDVVKSVVNHAGLVIAQVNEEMPLTSGDSLITLDSIHYLVDGREELIERPPQIPDPVSITIGRHVADIITDGSVLHFDRSPVSSAAMRYLERRKDLGLHTDILTDDHLRLIQSGAVNNRRKQVHAGRSIATSALGTRQLYRAIDANPAFELHPIEKVNDPFHIATNRKMVVVRSVEEIELSGLARVGSGENALTSRGLPSTMDFIEGANRSEMGLVILALPSTTDDGRRSRIVGESAGRGIYFNRDKVDIVVTEYGSVHLWGLSLRERAIALISIAHPRFRKQLSEEAKQYNYVSPDQVIQPEHGGIYPHHYELSHTFKGGLEVFFRPIKPSDTRRMKEMFYSLSPDTVRMRYHATIKYLPDDTLMELTNIDYAKDMVIVGLTGPRSNRRIIAEGRCMYTPGSGLGEFDITVQDDHQGHGIGYFLTQYLMKIAYAKGFTGLYAEVLQGNPPTIALLDKVWPTAIKQYDSGVWTYTVNFPKEDLDRPKESILIHSPRYADYSYGEDHPFRPRRANDMITLIKQQGWLSEPWMRVEPPDPLDEDELTGSTHPDYLEALENLDTASPEEVEELMKRFNLGDEDCPIFPGLYDFIKLYVSATLTGVHRILEENTNVAFNPLGGLHHSSRAHAEGFCYINDAIVAIDALLAHGLRVAYIDIDAHHGNGVQDAYWKDDRVLVVSLHEDPTGQYPGTGFETEIGEGIGRGYTVNVPLPRNTDDEAYCWIFDEVVIPAVEAFEPNVVVAVVGGDTHRSDPLTDLCLTNNGIVTAMERIRDFSHHLLLLGGGGYNNEATTRAWARIWATVNRIDALPDYLMMMGGTFLGQEDLAGSEMVDMSYRVSGEEKEAIMQELERIAAYHSELTLPLLSGNTEASSDD